MVSQWTILSYDDFHFCFPTYRTILNINKVFYLTSLLTIKMLHGDRPNDNPKWQRNKWNHSVTKKIKVTYEQLCDLLKGTGSVLFLDKVTHSLLPPLHYITPLTNTLSFQELQAFPALSEQEDLLGSTRNRPWWNLIKNVKQITKPPAVAVVNGTTWHRSSCFKL